MRACTARRCLRSGKELPRPADAAAQGAAGRRRRRSGPGRQHGTSLACYCVMMRIPSKYRHWIVGSLEPVCRGGRRRCRGAALPAADLQDIPAA